MTNETTGIVHLPKDLLPAQDLVEAIETIAANRKEIKEVYWTPNPDVSPIIFRMQATPHNPSLVSVMYEGKLLRRNSAFNCAHFAYGFAGCPAG